MGDRPTIARHGPDAATHVRWGGAFGRRWCVAALVEVWGVSGGPAAEIARQVGAAIVAAAVPSPKRSLSATLRAGLIAADRRVREAAEDDPLLGAGASVVAWDGHAVLLAQCGPALAYARRPAGAEPERLPPDSPWLQPTRPESADAPRWPALGWPNGRPSEPQIHWTALDGAAGLTVVLCTTPAVTSLSPEVVRALLATPAVRGGNALAAALPPTVPSIWFGLPAPREAHAARDEAPVDDVIATFAQARGGPTRDRAIGAAVGAAAARAIEASKPRLRELASGTVRLAEGLLPSRPPEHSRDERALAAAAGALVLPLAVAAIAGIMQLRLGDASTGAPTPVAAVTDAMIDASVPGDPPVRRLAGIEVAAPLAGGQADPRVLVVAPDAEYVLNRAQGVVERISAENATPRLVLALGQEVGGQTVGVLEDLAWLPHEGGGGRVVALDSAGHLWQVDGTPRPIALSPPPAQASPARLAGQDGQLYLLDRAGAITRYRLADADAGTATEGGPWIQGVDLAKAVDMAIDGAVFVLFEDGRIARFADGREAGFAVTGLEPALADPRGFFAGPALGRLLVADAGNGRIVDLSTGGTARARLLTMVVAGAQPGTHLADGRFTDLHAVWWQPDPGRLWIVAGAFLLRAPFEAGG